jgi:hypothetical protein
MDNCNEVLMARSSVGGYGYRPKDYGLRALLMLANLYVDSVDRKLLTLDPPKSPLKRGTKTNSPLFKGG